MQIGPEGRMTWHELGEEGAKGQQQPTEQPPEAPQSITDNLSEDKKQRLEDAKKRLNDKLNRMGTGPDPAILMDAIEVTGL